jgi:hypothetical protein
VWDHYTQSLPEIRPMSLQTSSTPFSGQLTVMLILKGSKYYRAYIGTSPFSGFNSQKINDHRTRIIAVSLRFCPLSSLFPATIIPQLRCGGCRLKRKDHQSNSSVGIGGCE